MPSPYPALAEAVKKLSKLNPGVKFTWCDANGDQHTAYGVFHNLQVGDSMVTHAKVSTVYQIPPNAILTIPDYPYLWEIVETRKFHGSWTIYMIKSQTNQPSNLKKD